MNYRRIATLAVIASVSFSTVATSLVGYALPADAPAASTLQQRIAQRKAEQKVVIEEKLRTRLENRCMGTQATLRGLQSQVGNNITNRSKVYQQIDGKLWIAIGQLKLAEKDTFNFENEREALANKVTAFEKTASQYKQAIDDIVVMDCKADLEGFVSLVQTARQYHEEIRKQAADIKTYTVDTIKTSLSNFAKDL